MPLYDFHVHSYYSDGTFSPENIIKKAAQSGITQMALTDHDNVSGLDEISTAAVSAGIKLIKGIEVSSQDKDCPVIHMLGFYIRDYAALKDIMQENAAVLRERNSRILNYLHENCNLNVQIDDLYAHFKGSVGKGNIAIYLKDKGYVPDYRTAEDLMRPYQAGNYGVDVKAAIKAIHNAGGIACLAHPYNLKKENDVLLNKLKEFQSYGLDGVECFHSNHSPEQTELYLNYARQLKLKISGGSDFHGDFKPNIKLGYGKKTEALLKNEYITINQ